MNLKLEILFRIRAVFYCPSVFPIQGSSLKKTEYNHCCIVRQKELSIKVEMSKVESFYWNKLSKKNFSFKSEQFFYLCFASAVQGVALMTFSTNQFAV